MEKFLRQGLWFIAILSCFGLRAQVLINEDFSTATGTTPPTGWVNNDINSSGEVWSFANPGGRTLNSPITSPAAIFDSDNYGSGGAEDAALESPAFNASTGTIVLTFDHYFNSGFGGSYAVEVFDGTDWDTITMGSALSTANPQSESFDITALAGASTAAQVRFHWKGDYSWYWILDNVKVEIVSCLAPSALGATNITATGADLFWTSGGASNWDVEYGPNGFTPGTGTLVNATNDTISVAGLSATSRYEFYVRDSCGVGNVSGWTGPFSFITGFIPPTPLSCATGNPTTVFTEEFDAVNGWTGDINGGNDTWEIPGAPTSSNTGPDNEHSGPAGSFMNFEASNTSSSSGQVVSPAIDLTAATGDAELSFWMHAYGADMGRLTVGVGTSATGPFTPVFTWAGPYQTSGSDPWANIGADLSSYVGQTIYLQFHQLDSVSGYEGDMSIDLVEVSACVSCAAPSMLGATNLTSSSADIYWTSGGASNWNVEYGLAGFTPGTGTPVNATNDTITLSGLTQVTNYEFYVRDSCAVGDVSGWAGPFSFLTPCPAALSGTYTINGSIATGGTNYNTFAEAATALNNCGISSAVTFNVQPGLYVDQLHIIGVAGVSATNTITFNGAGGDTLVWDGNGEQGTVIIENTSHVTLQNMLIVNQASSEAWGVLLINNSDTVTIDNCIIAMDSVSTSSDISAVLVSDDYDNDLNEGADVDALTVTNSTLIGGYYAMNFEGMSTGNPSFDYTITNNVIRSFNIAALYLDEIENLTITGNTIESSRGSSDGLYMFDVNNYLIEGNIINVTDYGLYISDGNDGFTTVTNSRVVNNMITSTADYGIYLNDFENTDVFHNSVVGEPAIRINDQVNLDARNNIFVSMGDFAFESDDALGATDVVDYNLYYSTGTNAFDISTSTYADLALWQAGDPTKNINSLSGDPIFFGSTDLHVLGTLANNAGDATVGVLVDIDNDVRSLTTPDIGADEFAPATCTPSSALISVGLYADSAIVAWSPGTGMHFNLEYGAAGFAPGTGTMVSGIVDTFYTITGLSPNTAYDFYLQDSCGVGDVSIWVGPGSFSTYPSPVSVPYTEDFEGATNDMAISSASDASAGVDTFGCASTNAILFTGGSSSGWSGGSTSTSPNQAWVVNTTKQSQALLLVDATPVSGSLFLEFDLRQQYSYGPDYNWFRVLINDTAQVTPDYQASTSTGDTCTRVSIDISAYAGTLFSVKFQAANKYAIGTGTGNGDNTFLDNVNIFSVAPAGCATFASNAVNDSLCVPGNTAFATTPGSYLGLLDGSGNIIQAGAPLSFFTNKDTTVSVTEVVPNPLNSGHVGPLTSIATSGFGNFSNGQWINVLDTIRIDSMTVRANGAVTAQLVINNAANTTVLQRGALFTTGAATADYQVEVGVVLTPGVYFMNVSFISGSGQLFRATSGASYPYTLPGLMSIDSTNFSSQSRIYYTFDMVVTEACLGTPTTTTAYIVGQPAGNDATVVLCDDGTMADLTTYLSADAASGGTFSSTNAGAALSGNMFDPTLVASGTYDVLYITASLSGCPADTAELTVLVQNCSGCATLVAPVATNDTICGPGNATLTATGDNLVWYNPADSTLFGGSTFTDSVATTTTYNVRSVFSAGPAITLGPSVTTNPNAYPTGNFTNGQYITVSQTVRIDSATFAVNGPLDFVVAIQDAQRTDTIQFSQVISYSGADTAAMEIGVVLTPGTYFMNTIPLSGTGILYRMTGGAAFPYGVPGYFTADSSDFGPSRYYYFHDMKVSSACLSAAVPAMAVVTPGSLNAGMNATDTICDSIAPIDVSTYLGAGVTPGGTWIDVNTSGGLSGNMFDPSAVAVNQTYVLRYVVSNSCGTDSADVSLYVDDCGIGLDENLYNKVQMYPNPTQDVLNIDLTGAAVHEARVEVYSVNGQLLLQQNSGGQKVIRLDMGDLAKGVYTIKVSTPEGVLAKQITKH